MNVASHNEEGGEKLDDPDGLVKSLTLSEPIQSSEPVKIRLSEHEKENVQRNHDGDSGAGTGTGDASDDDSKAQPSDTFSQFVTNPPPSSLSPSLAAPPLPPPPPHPSLPSPPSPPPPPPPSLIKVMIEQDNNPKSATRGAESYYGLVETAEDAILIVEACRRSMLPRVKRRLGDRDRASIRSGSVFVFIEEESGIRRWTDGKIWSPSRIFGEFLLYRQLEQRVATVKRPLDSRIKILSKNGSLNNNDPCCPTATSSSSTDEEDDTANQSDGPLFKKEGFTKKTISIIVDEQIFHLICYYRDTEVAVKRHELISTIPSRSPFFAFLKNTRLSTITPAGGRPGAVTTTSDSGGAVPPSGGRGAASIPSPLVRTPLPILPMLSHNSNFLQRNTVAKPCNFSKPYFIPEPMESYKGGGGGGGPTNGFAVPTIPTTTAHFGPSSNSYGGHIPGGNMAIANGHHRPILTCNYNQSLSQQPQPQLAATPSSSMTLLSPYATGGAGVTRSSKYHSSSSSFIKGGGQSLPPRRNPKQKASFSPFQTSANSRPNILPLGVGNFSSSHYGNYNSPPQAYGNSTQSLHFVQNISPVNCSQCTTTTTTLSSPSLYHYHHLPSHSTHSQVSVECNNYSRLVGGNPKPTGINLPPPKPSNCSERLPPLRADFLAAAAAAAQAQSRIQTRRGVVNPIDNVIMTPDITSSTIRIESSGGGGGGDDDDDSNGKAREKDYHSNMKSFTDDSLLLRHFAESVHSKEAILQSAKDNIIKPS